MKVEFKHSFVKDLKRVKDKTLLARVREAILEVEQTNNLQALVVR